MAWPTIIGALSSTFHSSGVKSFFELILDLSSKSLAVAYPGRGFAAEKRSVLKTFRLKSASASKRLAIIMPFPGQSEPGTRAATSKPSGLTAIRWKGVHMAGSFPGALLQVSYAILLGV
jgi:hypothetical protein